MICARCGGKGYVESYHAGAASFTPSLLQCPEFCNISGYSAEVQRRMNPNHVTERQVLRGMPPQKPVATVIPMRRKEPNEIGTH